MVTLLLISVAVLILLVAVYSWQTPSRRSTLAGTAEGSQLRAVEPASLFPTALESVAERDPHQELEHLRKRAATGDLSALDAAQKNFGRKVYDEILTALIQRVESDAQLLSLLTHVTRHELPVSKALAQATINSWQSSPDRSSTPRTLHITALADDAQLYQKTIETVLRFWKQGLLPNISAAELRSLFDGEFWVLSSNTRSSGAGFMLKRALAKARRELGAATNANQ